MGLFNQIFGGGKAAQAGAPVAAQFHESETTTEQGSKSAPRRELVQVVLRDTLRGHGVPSGWITCRILSVVSRSAMTGMHVHFIVHQGHDRLLTYLPALQTHFLTAIEKFEPQVSDWLLSLSWQFEGISGRNYASMPDPALWTAVTDPAPSSAAAEDDGVTQDLRALFAIRDAALKQDGTLPEVAAVDFQPTQPGR